MRHLTTGEKQGEGSTLNAHIRLLGQNLGLTFCPFFTFLKKLVRKVDFISCQLFS